MKQSRLWSVVEVWTGIVVGAVLALITQMIVFPMYGMTVSFGDNVQIMLVFTAVSFLRGYVLRRLFVCLGGKRG